MSVGVTYKHARVAEHYDAIVIGSGIGGLSAAAMLAKHCRWRVLVLEQHHTAGGYTQAFRRSGFEWDVGLHYLGDVNPPSTALRDVFDHLTDGALRWAKMDDNYDSIFLGDDRYDLVAGRANLEQRLCEYFPGDTSAIRGYFEAMDRANRFSELYFAEKMLSPLIDFLFGRLMRAPALYFAKKTTSQVLREITNNQRLIGVLTGQWGDYGLPPSESSFFSHSMLVRHYINGGAYPIGGCGRIVETIAPLIERAGGQVVTSAEVSEIIMRNEKAVGVRMRDGRELLSNTVISDAGAPNTYLKLLPADAPGCVAIRKTIQSIGPSLAHATLFVGTNKTAKELGLRGTNQWRAPSEDHDGNVSRFFDDPSSPFPMIYLSFPSARDPDYEKRCPGAGAIIVITNFPFKHVTRWLNIDLQKNDADYEAFKKDLSGRLLERLVHACPTVKEAIAYTELTTPLTTRELYGHPHGEVYGLGFGPSRYSARALKPRSPIKNLFLTGADACTGGVGSSLMGGLLCASVIAKKNLLGAALRPRK